jgi:hypothetical protein
MLRVLYRWVLSAIIWMVHLYSELIHPSSQATDPFCQCVCGKRDMMRTNGK